MESGARTAELNRDGAQILADAGEVQRWTELILAGDSGASRIERLEAWAARADMADYVWGWYAFYLQDQYTADRELEHFRQVVADGIAEADAGPIEDVDEISPIRNLYIKAMFLAYIDGDVATAEALSAKVQELSMREITTMQEATAKSFAFCWETRAYDAAVAALADGDVDTAQSELDKALRINPNHLPSLLEAVGLALREEDLSRSLELATHTTTVHPTSPEAWSALGRVTFAMDDLAASEIAYQRLLEIAAGYPEQHQLATVLDALDALKEQTNAEPDQRERIPEIAPLFERALDAMPESFGKAFQYPQAYGELGRLSLYAGDRSGAERLLRRSLEIDPHHPNFQALLVLSVLAQGKAAESEITAAVAESRDPVWDSTEGSGLFGDSIYASLSPTAYLDRMASEAAAFADAFPEMADRLTPFTDAITAERGLVDAAA